MTGHPVLPWRAGMLLSPPVERASRGRWLRMCALVAVVALLTGCGLSTGAATGPGSPAAAGAIQHRLIQFGPGIDRGRHAGTDRIDVDRNLAVTERRAHQLLAGTDPVPDDEYAGSQHLLLRADRSGPHRMPERHDHPQSLLGQ